MIIHSIKASNVLKYDALDLSDLPEKGIIAISGLNESGKSTIGETICFALFGRTFSIDDDDLIKIIRWGESSCTATICFSSDKSKEKNTHRYAVSRTLDNDGNHSAKLYSMDDADNPIARGVEKVQQALYDLTSISYEEFIESFYLAQREITTPHPHSYALKSMAGIATIEYCEKDIQKDIVRENSSNDESRINIVQLEESLDELDIEAGYLETLTSQHDEALNQKALADESLANYQSGIKDYYKATADINQHASKKSRGGLWRSLSMIVAIFSFSLWWLLEKMPGTTEHTYAVDTLHRYIPQFNNAHYEYLLYAGIAATLLILVFSARIMHHKNKIKTLRVTGMQLSEHMQDLDKFRSDQEDDTENSADSNESRNHLISQVSENRATDNEISEGTRTDIEYLIQSQNEMTEYVAELSNALSNEQSRVNRANEVQQAITTLETQIKEKEHRNAVRQIASELLKSAARHLSKRFNVIVREHVSKTLPLFTENRYEHLQIDDDLTVRVFSNEKLGFLDLDEISSGTQRQIMLAVRLALSQEMIGRKVRGRQFMILDEPFAFFDAERTEKSLSALPAVSEDLSQVWIIAQSFPDGMNFDRVIDCERGQH